TMGVSGEPPAPYGRYQNIFLSQTEYDELQAEYPDRLERFIEEMSRYLAANGKSYQNYAAALRSEERRVGKGRRPQSEACDSSRRRHTRSKRDWSSDVCSSDLNNGSEWGAARALWPIPEYFSVADRIRRVAGRVPRQVGTVHRGNEPLPCRQREKLSELCRRPADMGGERQKESPEKGHTRLLMQGGREFMKNEINAVLENMTATTPEPEDYTGEDGLLYCGKCRKPKEAYFAPDKAAIFGRDRHPAECDCQRAAREEREAAEKRRRHLDTVEELKRRGFTDPTMRDW